MVRRRVAREKRSVIEADAIRCSPASDSQDNIPAFVAVEMRMPGSLVQPAFILESREQAEQLIRQLTETMDYVWPQN